MVTKISQSAVPKIVITRSGLRQRMSKDIRLPNFSKTQMALLQDIARNGSTSVYDASKRMGKTQSTVQDAMKKLHDACAVEYQKTESKKGGLKKEYSLTFFGFCVVVCDAWIDVETDRCYETVQRKYHVTQGFFKEKNPDHFTALYSIFKKGTRFDPLIFTQVSRVREIYDRIERSPNGIEWNPNMRDYFALKLFISPCIDLLNRFSEHFSDQRVIKYLKDASELHTAIYDFSLGCTQYGFESYRKLFLKSLIWETEEVALAFLAGGELKEMALQTYHTTEEELKYELGRVENLLTRLDEKFSPQ